MSAKSQGLKDRTEAFAINVVKFCETLPNSMAGRRIGEQLLDSGTSVASNYRAACRAFTRPLFVSKLAIVAEEADESEFWFGVILKTGLSVSSAATTPTPGGKRADGHIHRIPQNRPFAQAATTVKWVAVQTRTPFRPRSHLKPRKSSTIPQFFNFSLFPGAPQDNPRRPPLV
jgi:four helix bundle protein